MTTPCCAGLMTWFCCVVPFGDASSLGKRGFFSDPGDVRKEKFSLSNLGLSCPGVVHNHGIRSSLSGIFSVLGGHRPLVICAAVGSTLSLELERAT